MAYGDVTPVGTIPSGATPNGALEFDTTQAKTPVMAAVDSTHVLVCWSGAGDDGFAQVMLDDGSGNWSAVGTALEFDTVRGGRQGDLVQVDSNHFLHVYSGSGSDGYALVLEVNLSTFAVTAPASALEFDTVNFSAGSVCQLDSTHFLTAYAGTGDDGFATVLEVDTGDWSVTEASGSKLEWLDAATITRTVLLPISSSRVLLVYQNGSADVTAQCLAINTGTWAVTTTGTGTNLYDAGTGDPVAAASTAACWLNGSTTHALVAWSEPGEAYFRVVALDGSYNASAVDTAVNIAFTAPGVLIGLVHVSDDVYLAAGWGSVAGSDAYAHTLDVDSSTYAVTSIVTNTQIVDDSSAAAIEAAPDLLLTATGRVTAVYEWSGNDGYLQSFTVELTTPQTITPAAVTAPATLYQPTLTQGTFVTPDTLNDPATVHTPTVVLENQTVSPAVISAPATVYQPTLVVANQDQTVLVPTIHTDSTVTEPPIVENADTVWEPTVVNNQNVTPDALTSPATVNAPTVAAAATITPDTITASADVKTPEVIPNQSITLNVIESGGSTQQPSLYQEQFVTPATVTAADTVHIPAVTGEAGSVSIDEVISAPATVHAPTVILYNTIIVDVLTVPATVQNPTVTATLVAAGSGWGIDIGIA